MEIKRKSVGYLLTIDGLVKNEPLDPEFYLKELSDRMMDMPQIKNYIESIRNKIHNTKQTSFTAGHLPGHFTLAKILSSSAVSIDVVIVEVIDYDHVKQFVHDIENLANDFLLKVFLWMDTGEHGQRLRGISKRYVSN